MSALKFRAWDPRLSRIVPRCGIFDIKGAEIFEGDSVQRIDSHSKIDSLYQWIEEVKISHIVRRGSNLISKRQTLDTKGNLCGHWIKSRS